jgi:cell division transport system permease protein
MLAMPWVTYFLRKTFGNMRREPVMNGATVLALAVAFLCFCSFLFVATAFGQIVSRWAADYHVSVYLEEGVSDEEARRVARTFEALGEVQRATVVTSDETRQRLVSDLGGDQLLGGLDPRLFPTTVELRLHDGVRDPALITALAERLQALAVVDQVETYGDLFARLRTVSVVARAVSVVLGLIVLLATLLVVANTIRLSLLGRRDEIEIMKLCGATDRFVRAPFLMAGALQGLLGALISLALIAMVGGVLHRAIGPLAPALLTGWSGGVAGLSVATAVSVVLAGTLLGLAGSHLSVRRFLREAP